MRQYHFLKTEKEHFQATEKGLKHYELRENDRNYKVGDMIHLLETVKGIETGRVFRGRYIIHILKGGKFGLNKDYCILQLDV